MTRTHNPRPRRQAAAKREAARIVAALEAADLARFLAAERVADAIDAAEWLAQDETETVSGMWS